jgi:AcrR family transcriptional regulator
MARTQAADYEQRREAIVDKAAELYAERGFLGASVADLAAACGSSKSLIYHYYGAKEEILYDVMATHIADLEAAMAEVEAAGLPPAKALRAVARAFMGRYAGAAARHKVLLNELDHLPAERRSEIVGRQRWLVRQVERLMIAIAPELRDRPGRTWPNAMLFFGMINWTHTWYDPARAVTSDELADMAVDMVLYGLGGPAEG